MHAFVQIVEYLHTCLLTNSKRKKSYFPANKSEFFDSSQTQKTFILNRANGKCTEKGQ